MKKSRIIAPALGVLVLSTAASITGTVAWFTANNSVQVTGMKINTKVGSNLLISATNTNDDNYADALTQTRTGLLEPASTIDGVNYFYNDPSNVNASGAAKAATYISYSETTSLTNNDAGKSNYSADFQTKNGIETPITVSNVAYAYIDYSFYLKATNAADAAKELRMTTCNFLYDGDGEGTWQPITEKAWRVAIFAKASAAETTTNDEVAAGNLVSILTPVATANSAALYFTSGKAVAAPADVHADPEDPESAVTTAALQNVTNLGSGAVVATIAKGATAYTKVTVRLWLEGEDKTCNNETFASLTNDYKLDLGFEINEEHVAVTQIGSVAA